MNEFMRRGTSLMENDTFSTVTDIELLRMENELLAFENQYLRARLSQADRPRDNTEAEQELIIILKKMASRPYRWLFVWKESFRVLEKKYLNR